jgi:hypothetical protein
MIGKRALLFLFTKEMTNQRRHRIAKIPVLQLHCSSSTSKSLIKTKYNRPDSTFPCQTPSETDKYLDWHWFTTTALCVLTWQSLIIFHILNDWKKGLIVPIYKGNDKPKTSSDSYRPISLLPCFLKVFENVLKSRLNLILHESVFPNRQQQGFQKYIGCLAASFNLHETIFHNLETIRHFFQSLGIISCLIIISNSVVTHLTTLSPLNIKCSF